jgi:hypothetical protein
MRPGKEKRMSEEKKVFVITGQAGAEWRVTGTRWTTADTGYLGVFDGEGRPVAEFAPGQWSAVIDEANRAPDPAGALAALAAKWQEAASDDGGARDWTPGATGLPETLLGRADGFRECARQLLAAIGQPS